MTIYALIDTPAPRLVWTIMTGASMLQGGNPYFLPDFAQQFEAVPSLALRIGKLGKGFAPRFSHRYVECVAPCAVMVATDLLATLRKAGLPWTSAICYDRSLALGQFIKTDFAEISILNAEMRLDTESGTEVASLNATLSGCNPAELISGIARDNTLKTGDMVILPFATRGLAIATGMKATLLLNGEESVKFNIR